MNKEMNQSTIQSPQVREAALFALAVEQPADARAAFLRGACGADETLLQRLKLLLAAYDRPDRLLREGAGSEVAPVPANSTVRSSTVRPRTDDEELGQTLGRYKLLERLGEGGCGVVYVAEQAEPVRRRVALKVIKLGMDTKQVVARFEAERQALALMDHPNIAKVFDAGTSDSGRPYFVMELVRGIRITEYCDQNHLSTRERLALFINVCQAIQHAHQKGIIHRDIKPSNILVTLHDGLPVPKVIDFGIAKATEGRLTDVTVYTQLHQFIGTPAYMSPEQAEMSGLDIDTRSDIYSLGVVLYELLTGQTPFDGKQLIASGLDEMRRTIRETEPVRPSTRLASLAGGERTKTAQRQSAEIVSLIHLLRGDLDWIVMKCLEKDRSWRYETASSLAADLKRHLSHEPVSARPPSPAYRLQKAWRRNKFLFTSAASVVLALLLGLGISVSQYLGKSRAEREQHRLRQQAETKAQEAQKAHEQAAQQRDLAQARLYDALLREAGSIRQARQVGYRRQVIDRVQQAMALQVAQKNGSALREEVTACMGDPVGLDPVDLPTTLPDILSGTVSSDGALLALGAERVISIWDIQKSTELARLQTAGPVIDLNFNPESRKLLAIVAGGSAISSGTVLTPGTVAFATLESWQRRKDGSYGAGPNRPVPGLSKILSTGPGPVGAVISTNPAAIEFVDLQDGRPFERLILPSPPRTIPRVGISYDRSLAALVSSHPNTDEESQLELWDIVRHQSIAKTTSAFGVAVGLSFSLDSRYLAATFADAILVFNTARLQPVMTLRGYFGQTGGAVLGPQGTLMAVPLYQENAVRLFNVVTGTETAYLRTPDAPFQIQLNQDGTVLTSASRVGPQSRAPGPGIRCFRLAAADEKRHLVGHVGGVPAVAFSPAADILASAGKDRTIRFWSTTTGQEIRRIDNLPGPGQSLAFSPDGERLASTDFATRNVSVWEVESGRLLLELKEPDSSPSGAWSCAFAPNGQTLAATGRGVRLWQLQPPGSGSASAPWSATLLSTVAGPERDLAFDPSGKWLACVGRSGSQQAATYILDVRDPQRRIPVATNLWAPVQHHCFTPRTGKLAYLTDDRALELWDPVTQSLTRRIPTLRPGESATTFLANLAVSPDETMFALTSRNGLGVDIWNLGTGTLRYSLPDEPGSIWWVAWSPDGQHIAVARSNGGIAIWSLKTVHQELARLGLDT